ncbi:DUF2218 domain-containing protein [Amycolatopsis sp. NPDC005003]
MLTAEARIDTARASRYLVQLCRHAGEMGRGAGHRLRAHAGHRPPELQSVDWSETEGTIATADARCTVQATESALTLRAEAADEQQLARVQELVGKRLETIGRRDQLRVIWRPPQGNPDPATVPGKHRGNLISIAAVVVLVIAVHIGLGTAVLSDARWTWAADAVAAIVVVKVVVVTVIARRRRNRA